MRFRAHRFFGVFLLIFFVGAVFYYVFDAVAPLRSPRVSYEFVDGERMVSVFVPYSCDEALRVFRFHDERGRTWERVGSAYRREAEGCTFLEPAREVFANVSSVFYRYQLIDVEEGRTKWSEVELLTF